MLSYYIATHHAPTSRALRIQAKTELGEEFQNGDGLLNGNVSDHLDLEDLVVPSLSNRLKLGEGASVHLKICQIISAHK